MKKVLIILISALWANYGNAQSSGIIAYKETIKMNIKLDGDHGGIDLSQYLPESTTFYKELHYNSNESVYIEVDGESVEDTEIESDDGSFKMVISQDDGVENILYINRKNKSSLEQTGFMGKEF